MLDICFGTVSDESATRTIREQSTPSRISVISVQDQQYSGLRYVRLKTK